MSPGLRSVLAAALALTVAGCGGGSGGDSGAAAPFAPADGATLADCRTAIVVVVDGLGPGDLPGADRAAGDDAARGPAPPDLPALASLVAGGRVFERAVAPSTAGNSALASVLTGLSPGEHGVLSIHDVARARLAPAVPTFVEDLAGRGWRCFASLAARREARGVGGFARGFEAVDDAPAGVVARGAASVALGLDDVVGDALEGDGDVLVLLSFADLAGEVEPDLDHPGAAGRARARLARAAALDDELQALVERLDREPRAALDGLAERFSRSRGSGAARAWRAALRDIRLLAIDDALGALLGRLEETDRAEGALVVVLGLRGGGLDPVAPAAEGGRIPRSIATVPLVVRAPGSVGAGRSDALAATRAIAPWLTESLAAREGLLATDALVAERAATHNARGDVVALWTDDGRAFERDLSGLVAEVGEGGTSAAPEADTAMVTAALDGAPRTATLLARCGDEFAAGVRWRVSGGGAVEASGPFRPAAYGALGGEDGIDDTLSLLERGAALQLLVRGAGPERVVLGAEGLPLTAVPLAYTPAEDAPTLAEGDAPRLSFTRAAGLDWTLRIAGEGACEALVTVWPPRAFDDRLEALGYGVTLREVPGRRDLVHVLGELPLAVDVQKKGAERFAVVCWTEQGLLGPDRMASDGSWFAGPDGFDVVVPGWRPAVSERIGDPFDALALAPDATPLAPAPGDLALGRREPGPGPSRATALPLHLFELLLRLPAGE